VRVTPDGIEEFESLRPRLFAIAYRMLGRVSDAEDVVQDTFLRFQRALRQGKEIDSTPAFLSAIVTRLSINELQSARARREVYVGEWLPEPLFTDEIVQRDDPATHAEEADSLSLAFLVLLEQLSPVERAVFLLHDVFGYGYGEVATTVGKSEDNCRQLATRARRHIEAEKPRFEASRRERDRLAERFFAAVGDGNVDELVNMLADDVIVYGDGGGMSPSWPRPIVGRDRVSRLMGGVSGWLTRYELRFERHEVNGQPGATLVDPDGRIVNVFALDIVDGVIQTIRSVINPDKLRHLGPLADVEGMLRAIRDARRAGS
jgi:RNA polymerase sigma-70 factor (ECF subfamily)